MELARAYPSDTIARHPLAYRSLEVEADLAAEAAAQNLNPIDAELAMQRHERSASLRMGDDGMWHLRGKLDFLTGRQLSGALQAAVRSMRRRHNDNQAEGSGEDAPSQAHHIDHYEHDGHTDIPNLASLCEPCHKDLHTHSRKIHTPPNGRPRLQPPEPADNDLPGPDPHRDAAAAQGP